MTASLLESVKLVFYTSRAGLEIWQFWIIQSEPVERICRDQAYLVALCRIQIAMIALNIVGFPGIVQLFEILNLEPLFERRCRDNLVGLS